MYRWCSNNIWYHVRIWHSIEPLYEAMFTRFMLHPLAHCVPHNHQVWHQDLCNSLLEEQAWRDVLGFFLKISKLVHDLLRKMWIHQAWPTRQPSRLEGYVVQGTYRRVTLVWVEAYDICYSVVNKNRQLYHMILYVLGKGANMWPILNVVHPNIQVKWKMIHAWKWFR